MPTYQYSCTDCGHFLEAYQSFSEDSLTVCPECGGQLRKVFNAVGVVFKGSGFYRTDSRGKQSSSDAPTASSASSSGSTSGSASDSSSKTTASASTGTSSSAD